MHTWGQNSAGHPAPGIFFSESWNFFLSKIFSLQMFGHAAAEPAGSVIGAGPPFRGCSHSWVAVTSCTPVATASLTCLRQGQGRLCVLSHSQAANWGSEEVLHTRGHGQEEDHRYIQALFLGGKKKKEKKDKSLIHGLIPKIIILKCICYLHSARRVAF